MRLHAYPQPSIAHSARRAMYVYLNSEPGLFTVGFFDPSGKWHPESDFNDREEAAKRVAWLNGSHVAHE